ncbi:MAG: gephyrin-like molybdotransferase Glp, partial [Chloroflexota bacterium]
LDFPSFNNSSVDGFAVRAEDTLSASAGHPVILEVVADIPAGSWQQAVFLSAGQAARIMTGAPVPESANAIVMVEDTDMDRQIVGSAAPQTIKIFKAPHNGENIRRQATDFTQGQTLLTAGILLHPQHIALLAMLGVPSVPVHRKPRVALISSGDELMPVAAALAPGQIHDSNTYMLSALVQQAGSEVLSMGVAADRLDAVQDIFKRAADANPDLIISSAGVSTGAFDYVKEVVESAGSLNFWKVNMRPGKPLAFGSYRNIPFFGLPGNPVSSYVNFLVFVQPVLGILSGLGTRSKPRLKVILSEDIESDGRESYLRAVVTPENGRYVAHLPGHQGSGNLFSLVLANALLIIPADIKSLPSGTEVEAWMLDA